MHPNAVDMTEEQMNAIAEYSETLITVSPRPGQ